MSTIYFIIFIIWVIFIVWTWNSTKGFENVSNRILYIILGVVLTAIITYILFLFSKIGIEYPNQEMISEIRNILLLIFIPVNGTIVLPQVMNIMIRHKDGNISKEELQKKIRIILIICIIVIIFECIYFKSFQTEILDYINALT